MRRVLNRGTPCLPSTRQGTPASAGPGLLGDSSAPRFVVNAFLGVFLLKLKLMCRKSQVQHAMPENEPQRQRVLRALSISIMIYVW